MFLQKQFRPWNDWSQEQKRKPKYRNSFLSAVKLLKRLSFTRNLQIIAKENLHNLDLIKEAKMKKIYIKTKKYNEYENVRMCVCGVWGGGY